MKTIGKILSVLFWLVALKSYSQVDYDLKFYTQNQGLAHRSITDITRSASGRLWVGTRQGITFYDGTTFQSSKFFDKNGHIDEFMVLFIVDQDDNLIGISDANKNKRPFLIEDHKGKIHFNTQYIDTVRVMGKEAPFSLRHSQLVHTDLGIILAEILQSDLPDKTYDQGTLSFYEIINNHLNLPVKLSPFEFISATVHPDNMVWLWTSKKGYIQIDVNNRIYKWMSSIPSKSNHSQEATSFPLDSKGRFWYPRLSPQGSESLLTYFQVPDKFLESPFENFVVDNMLNVWLLNLNGDILKYDRSTGQVHLIESSLDYLSSSYIDAEKINWLGSKLGLFKLTFKNNLFENFGSKPIRLYDTAPIGKSTRKIFENNTGDIFVHLDYGHLHIVDTASNSILPFELFLEGKKVQLFINDMHYVSDTCLLIATSSGLFKANLLTQKLVRLQLESKEKKVINIIPGSEKLNFNLLLGNASLIKYNLRQESISRTYPLEDSINSIRAYDDRFIYATAKGKLIKYDNKDLSQLISFELSQSYDIGEADVRDVLVTDSMIWIGSYEGVYGLDTSDFSIKAHYTTSEGLKSNLIYSIIGHDYMLFAGTSSGLSVIDTRSNFIRTYLEKDGLSHNEFNSYSKLFDSQGYLWMGGLNGLNRFLPENLYKTTSTYSTISLNHILVYNPKRDHVHQINLIKDTVTFPLHLKVTENSFDLHFSLPSLYAPEENTYYWYIESMEPKWINSSNTPIIQYKNLSPGNYTLKLMAVDSKGTPSEVTSLDIFIDNHWYLSFWAILLWIFLFLMLVFLSIKAIVRKKINQEQAKQEKIVNEKRIKLYNDIAHEIRSPLTIIMGLADRIQKRTKYQTPEYIDDINKISHQSQALVNLCDEMLEVSRLNHNAGFFDKLDVIIASEFFNHFIPSFQSLVEDEDMNLIYECNVDPKLAIIAPVRKLQMILSNLITNAIKYSEAGGTISVSISSKSLKKDKVDLMIAIKDSGPGIDPIDRSRVFERYVKLPDQNQSGSHGIGLSIVKELVDSMEGRIDITNAPNKGAVFTIACTFKISQTPIDLKQNTPKSTYEIIENKSPIAANINKRTSDSQRESKIVLIVDDHSETRDFIQSCLQQHYLTKIAADGLEAFNLAKTVVPDLIISDVMMPKMDGFELCHQLKSDKITNHIPIILLTVKKDQTSSLTGLKHGADIYLPKPFNEDVLTLTVKNLFKLIENNQKYNRRLLSETNLTEADTEINASDHFVEQFVKCLKEHYHNPDFTVEALSKMMFMSRSQIFKKTKSLMGHSPSTLIKEFRLDIAKQHLLKTNKSISEISTLSGFSSPNYFSTSFQSKFGMSPQDFRKNAT